MEIEIQNRQNRSLYFLPLSRRLRGRIDVAELSEKVRKTFKKPIPGIVVGLEGNNAYLREPLYAAEHAATRAAIEKSGLRLGDEREEFVGVDQATWAHWIRRAVESGSARLISGELPEVKGTPRTTVFRQMKSSAEELVDKLVGLVGDLLKLPEAKRKELSASL